MGKYAPKKGCANCRAIGALCMDCAIDWKARHIDGELRILRRIARMCRAHSRDLSRQLARLDKHLRTKPPLRHA